MEYKYTLSIITCCKNSAETIERTIQSVISNKTDDIEYIVVDGQSEDETLTIIEKYREYIDTLIVESDNSLYEALNKGIRAAHGKYTMLLAADDYLIDGQLNKALGTIKDDTDVWCGSILFKRKYGYFLNESAEDLELLKYGTSLRNPASFFRKETFEKYGYYDESFKCSGDRELFLRFYLKGANFQIEKIPLVVFSNGGISSNDPLKYAIPEDKRIMIEYHIVDDVETYYKPIINKIEKKKNVLKSKICKPLLSIFYCRIIYSIICKVRNKKNTKLRRKQLRLYGL